MLSTTILVATFWIFLIAAFFRWAYFLRLGARWTKIEGVTYRRALFAGLLVGAGNLVVGVLFSWYLPTDAVLKLALILADLATTVLTTGLILSMIFKAPLSRCLLAWLATWIPGLALLAIIFCVWRPFVQEAFVMPTNSMAPTILGPHWEGVCPQCGRPTYCSPEESHTFPADRPHWVICEKLSHHEEFRTQQASTSDRPLLGQQTSQAAALGPRCFPLPGRPQDAIREALVALPGETVTIQNGEVWINGRAISPPEPLRGLDYVTEMDDFQDKLWGSPQRPAKLAADEYFVLGDFSRASKKLQTFRVRRPGHPPYAVPASYLYGVVTHIYWPPSRWRTFR